MSRPGRGLPVGLTLVTLVALAILLGLGTWQLQRLAWKEDLLTRVAALQAATARPAGPVLANLADGADVGFVRVEADCPGLASAPFLELYSLRGGQAGSRLISACPVAGGPYGTILVDRGFVADTVSMRPPVDRATAAPVRVVGVLRAPEEASFVTPANTPDRWFSRDVAAMARTLGAANPAPVFLMAETASNPDLPALVPSPLPVEIANRHLEYALTWYGLAGALVGVYAAMLWKRRNP